MPKVIFNCGNKGETYGKKRKRYPGTNNVMKNEVKQYNAYLGATASYDSISLSNVTNPTGEAQGQSYGWKIYTLADPAEGTESYNRIGNQYFLKYLRFKGYVRHYGYTPVDINWRLVLYRADTVTLTAWTTLYNNVHAMPQSPSADDITHYCRHNFYKKVWNTDASPSVKKKVIASGCLPKHSFYVSDGQYNAVGSSTNYGRVLTYLNSYNSKQDCIMPVDVKVTCNDWIKVGKIHYYICLEVDYGCAFDNVVYGAYTPVRGTNSSEQPLDLSFFIRGYFTDP